MSEDAIRPGLEGKISFVVADEHVPPHLRGTGGEVVSTPDLVWLVERASLEAIRAHLPPGQTTVGTFVSLKHMAGTPKGMRVEGRARLIERDRRRLVFEVEVHDEVEKVAEGRHERFLVERERKSEKLQRKVEMVREKGEKG